jgi:hypothetical protein
MQNENDAILTAALREIFGIDDENYSVSSIQPTREGFPAGILFTPVQNRQRLNPSDVIAQKQEQSGVNGNQEMANKINELYNEINLKDKDLKEARETIKRLQQNILDFRKRAETAELNASHTLTSHNELSARFNNLVEKYNKLKLEHKVVTDKVEYLLKRIGSEQNDLTYGVDLGFEEGDKHVEPNQDVDAISIPLSEAEAIINQFRGM